MYRVTDRQTDRQTDDMMMPIYSYCAAVRSAKTVYQLIQRIVEITVILIPQNPQCCGAAVLQGPEIMTLFVR